ncbi:hypothetical protein PIB30_111845, partial [Stylosanthes scabra]|nr:hypothetical protein [Stylosanthes scabra]
MVEELGYKSHNAILWFDKTAPELETGLNELDGDEAIRDLIDWLRENQENEFHVFIEHPIDKPVLAENDGGGEGVRVEQVHLVDGSPARDEATKEDAFETPHPGTDSQNADEIRASRSMRKRKARSPKKSAPSSKKDVAEDKGKGKAMETSGCGKNPKKVNHGKKKKFGGGPDRKHDEGPSCVDAHAPEDIHDGVDGPEVEGVRDGGRGNVKFYQPELVPSDEEYAYEYKSETLKTPVSTDEEDFHRHAWPEFNDDYAFGNGHF